MALAQFDYTRSDVFHAYPSSKLHKIPSTLFCTHELIVVSLKETLFSVKIWLLLDFSLKPTHKILSGLFSVLNRLILIATIWKLSDFTLKKNPALQLFSNKQRSQTNQCLATLYGSKQLEARGPLESGHRIACSFALSSLRLFTCLLFYRQS